MVELLITKKDCGGRLDKYLIRYLKEAPTSFIYKMIRKKNIVLNGKKASGSEILAEQDKIRLFLADETIIKFGGYIHKSIPAEREVDLSSVSMDSEFDDSFYEFAKDLKWIGEIPKVLYEDSHILILSKPTDILSQGAKKGDISLNDWISYYLIQKGELTREDLLTIKPSVVNRLDRNTSGIILAGKTLSGLRFLSDLIKSKRINKFYLTVVKGTFHKTLEAEAYLLKNINHNVVKIYDENVDGASLIKTIFTPLAIHQGHSLLRVALITGKSHQIRAHLHHLNFPVIGDGKYGLKSDNLTYKRLGLKHQFLHSFEIRFPEIEGEFSYLSKKKVIAPLSVQQKKILEKLGLDHYEIF